MEGVENGDPTCDKDGQCTCKCDVTGRKCDVCEVGHQGFPDCHGKQRLYHFESFNIKSSFFDIEIPGFYEEAKEPVGCNEGWTEISGKCYKVSTERTSWFKATEECGALGGKLVEPMNAGEQEAVAALAKVSIGMENYWIGLTDKEIEDK